MERLNEVMKEALEEGAFPGASVLVSLKSELVFKKAWGNKSIWPNKEELCVTDIFDVASLTKPIVTTYCIIDLILKGRLTLSTTLKDLSLEGYTLLKYDESKAVITIKDLLLHSAGFASYYPFFDEYKVTVSKDVIYRKILDMKLAYEPGKRIVYSDLGFMLLEAIINYCSGIEMKDYFEREILKDIPVEYTFLADNTIRYNIEKFVPTEYCKWRNQLLRGIVHDENAFIMGGHSGHAGLFSTAEDLYRIIMAMQTKLRASSLEGVFWNIYETPDGSKRALGWDVRSGEIPASGRYFSHMTVGHLGFTGCSIWMDLNKELMVILLTNRVHPSRKNQTIKIFRPKIHDAICEDLGLTGR